MELLLQHVDTMTRQLVCDWPPHLLLQVLHILPPFSESSLMFCFLLHQFLFEILHDSFQNSNFLHPIKGSRR